MARRKGHPCTLLVGPHTGTTHMENSMEIPPNTKNEYTTWPSDSTSRYLYRENKNNNWKMYMYLMFTAVFFIIPKLWMQLGVISWWLDKEDVKYMLKYYVTIRKNEIMPFETTWMSLKNMLSEIYQVNKDKYCTAFTYTWNIKTT